MELRKILEAMIERRASDLHLKVGTRPTLRVDGELVGLDDHPPVTTKDMERELDRILTAEQKEEFLRDREIDFAFGVQGFARFRSNFYYQRGTIAMAIRHVPLGVPAIEDLNLPPVVEQLALRPRGLVLVTGTVGSGKSTTLAAMIDSINRTHPRNIITIEDPIEFIHRDDKSMISQREVGLDTETFSHALKHILRQDPDVILLGEIRDRDTMSVALMAADTGHLVLSTLHTIDAAQTVNRIISFYPPHQHDEVRYLLSSTLQAVISQRLIPRSDGVGRVPAVEVMVTTPTIQEYLLDPEKTMLIKQVIHEGVTQYGMQTFDQSLMKLYRRGLITLEEAVAASTSPTEFELRVRGIQSSSDAKWAIFETGEGAEEGAEGSEEARPGDQTPPGMVRY
ncbi:MAG: PilT/PilU family type 4a pilus ATPase [Candidatus Eisenbacteria bacterium]|nr:PilT/PilU family type 4a pilus ATPase [Candidatus Latescibacterota bacterium]MBD3302369.1 PilT/PilU family type 4a pilus ATPase [Candidatus Eisenbacteria bacterium]